MKSLNAVLESAKDFAKFKKQIYADYNKKNSRSLNEIKRNLTETQKRISKIDMIIKEMYEDKVNGNISLEIFQKLSSEYCLEQKELSSKVLDLKKKCAEFGQTKTALKGFFDIVQKYMEHGSLNELTPEIVSEFIDRIEIGETKKVDGKRQQQVNIYFRGIGLLDSEILR